MESPFTVGITGGIGAGKSVVSRTLRCSGFPVYDCDSEAKRIMTEDQEVRKVLVSQFGENLYTEDGALNTKFLASIIFRDSEKRNFVNSVVHLAVKKDIEKERRCLKGFFFIESAIIFTGGLVKFCDSIWVITAPLKERIERVLLRDHSTVEAIEARIKSQEKEFSELERYHPLVLDNSDHKPLLAEILKLINRFNNLQTYKISC